MELPKREKTLKELLADEEALRESREKANRRDIWLFSRNMRIMAEQEREEMGGVLEDGERLN